MAKQGSCSDHFAFTARLIPVEILEHIVTALLSQEHAFSSIASFSLVSFQFRQIALRRYYSRFSLRSPRHWIAFCGIPGILHWVSELQSSTSSLQRKIDILASFTSLRTLELDFSSDGLSTQKSRSMLLFKHVVASLTRLKLTSLPQIDTALLSLVASRFPSLKELNLSCTERLDDKCCWLCFEESSSCVVHSPIPDLFSSAQTLVTVYANALKPLRKLEQLFLGVFLSEADVLYRHLDRCASVVIASPKTGAYPAPPFGPNQCALCQAEHNFVVRERERFATALMYKLLPSLKNVGWSTYFAEDASGNDVRHQAVANCIRPVVDQS